jgi:hypothetical protein
MDSILPLNLHRIVFCRNFVSILLKYNTYVLYIPNKTMADILKIRKVEKQNNYTFFF